MVFKNEWIDQGGSYFRFDKGVVSKGFDGVTIANGTAFSLDGRTMYRSESMARIIFALDYEPETGVASNQRQFVTLPKGVGIPDGATVDSEGCYWCAAPFGPDGTAHVLRFSQDGELVLKIPMPVTGITIVAFGGPSMSTLYVSSGKIEWMIGGTSSELSGSLFSIETPFRGVPEPMCRCAPVRR
jgi:sugar lactone lactonase YvrE